MNDQLIAKIQKLLNLAENSAATPAEAATAAAMAQKLMSENRISQAEVIAAGDAEENEEVKYHDKDPLDAAGKLASWLVNLAGAVANANDCKILVRPGRSGIKNSAAIIIVGRDSDVSVCRYIFAFCKNEINRLSRLASIEKKFLTGNSGGKRFSNSFKLGAVSAVRDNLMATKQCETEYFRKGGNEKALVHLRSRRQDVVDFLKGKSGKSYRTGGATDYSGRAAGYKAGQGINLNQSLGSGNSRGRLLGA